LHALSAYLSQENASASATEGLRGNNMVNRVSSFFDVRKQNKKRLFVVLVFFLISFSIARLYSLYFHFYVYISGYHIHHFYFGALTLALGGILGIMNNNDNKRRLFIACGLIGTGMGLFADEIGLLLNSTNSTGMSEYFFPDSGDIILTIGCSIVFLIAIADMDIKALAQKCSSLKSVLVKALTKWQGHSRQVHEQSE
jgi:hypothetical protein